ncbi:hypothetical protein T492DRAFT_912770 [Pavlovales sp. CCMP2436]|nr:hypothetical protein T492DRAFT_912770 [Pavlovales sp. CCMP2436]
MPPGLAPAERNDYATFLEVQLERMTTAALAAASFDERITALQRRHALTDANLLGSVRLAKSAEACAREAKRTADRFERMLEDSQTLAATQRDALGRYERSLGKLRADVEGVEAHLAMALVRADRADDQLLAQQAEVEAVRRTAERDHGWLRAEIDGLRATGLARTELLDGVREEWGGHEHARGRREGAGAVGGVSAAAAAAAAAATQGAVAREIDARCGVVEEAMTQMEERIVEIVSRGLHEARQASAAAVAAAAGSGLPLDGRGGADGTIGGSAAPGLAATDTAIEALEARAALNSQRFATLAHALESSVDLKTDAATPTLSARAAPRTASSRWQASGAVATAAPCAELDPSALRARPAPLATARAIAVLAPAADAAAKRGARATLTVGLAARAPKPGSKCGGGLTVR